MLDQLLSSSLIRKAYQISKNNNQDIFLVGGAIRDLFLNVPMSNDFDFLVKSNVKSIASEFSKLCKGSYFCLDKMRNYYRVVINDPDKHHTVDFSPIVNGNINSDLLGRDFSINSIALGLSDIFEKKLLIPIDPTSGLSDFENRIVRASSHIAFNQDPVRILRAVRFARKLNFSIESHTLNLIKENMKSFLNCPWERIRSEFFKILDIPNIPHSLRTLDQLEILPLMIPEIESLKGVEQGMHHDYDLWEHSLKTVHFTETILCNTKDHFPQFGEYLDNYFQQELEIDIQRKHLLSFIALLHDIGKPLTKSTKNNQVHFYHHDRIGAKITQEIAHRFKLGRKTTRIITTSTRYHMRLLNYHSTKDITQRAMYRFFRDLGDASFDTLVLICADKMATSTSPADTNEHLSIRALANDLVEYYFKEYSKNPPHSLLSGNEIIELFVLKPGKRIGELITLVEEAEREGRITTREEAIKLITSETKRNN